MNRLNYGKALEKDDSDISEADQNDIAKILKETDDIDEDFYKFIGAPSKQSLSNTLPATLNKPPAHPPSTQKPKNNDDDFMGDLDAILERKSRNTSRDNSADKKPPLAQQQQIFSATVGKKTSGLHYDDEDMDESKIRSNVASNKSKSSLADELFGRSKEPSTYVNSNQEFKLSEKYTKLSQESAAKNIVEDDPFAFGGYVPSALVHTPRSGGPGASPSGAMGSRRNVQFNDDLFSADLFATRPKTSPNQGTSTAPSGNNLMKTMPNPVTKSDDWMGFSGNSKRDSSFLEELKPKAAVAQQHIKLSALGSDWSVINSMTKPEIFDKDLGSEILGSDYSSSKPKTADKQPLITSPLKQMEPLKITSTKDSVNLNSSFADSVEDNKTTIAPNSGPLVGNANKVGGSIFNSAPVQQSHRSHKEHDIGSIAASEVEDAWLTNLMMSSTNKSKSAGTGNNLSSAAIAKKMSATTGNLSYDSNEVQAMIQKIKQLEYENQDLHMQLQHNKAHYELQIQLIQDSYEERMRVMKEDRENSLRQFKEEKDSLKSHIEIIEKEKQDLSSAYKRKLDESQKEYDIEIERLRQIQRDSVEKLKDEHEEVIKRIKKFKETELNAAMSATSHTRTIESVLNLIEDNTKNLENLNQRVQQGHMMNLSDVEVQMKSKQENLRIQEERLAKQHREYENEIKVLSATIQRLEAHLGEQTKSVAEERWRSKQQEKKTEALQEALLNEQRIVMDKLARERNDIERTKGEILIEQKKLMQQVYEEKRILAEEKAYLEAQLSAYNDKKHKDSLSTINLEAEITVNSKRLHEEKERLDRLAKELDEKDTRMKQEKLKLDEKKQELEFKMAKLEQMTFSVNQRYEKAEDVYSKAAKEKEVQIKILEQVTNIKSNHDSRLNHIQQQLMQLSERESQINQEKVNVLKQRQELELLKTKITCVKCKDPIKDLSNINGLSIPSSGYGTAMFSTLNSSATINKYQQQMMSNNGYNSHMSDLDNAKQLRRLKIQALRDRQFINEEKQFIDNLKSNNNSLSMKSLSMNQLDSAIV